MPLTIDQNNFIQARITIYDRLNRDKDVQALGAFFDETVDEWIRLFGNLDPQLPTLRVVCEWTYGRVRVLICLDDRGLS